MKIKFILIFIVFATGLSDAAAQERSDSIPEAGNGKWKAFRERIQFNMGGGLMIGNTFTNINLLPQVGYRITDRLIAGVGGNFQYYRNTFFSTEPFIIYGGNVFSRYMLTDNLFAQGEMQMLNFDGEWGEYGLIGGGYLPSRGVYVSAYYLFLYPEDRNIYGQPYVLRVGFIF